MVDYDPLPVVSDPEAALNSASPLVHDNLANNIHVQRNVQRGNFDAACTQAEVMLNETFRIHRQAGIPLEPRGCVATWDAGTETLLIRSTTQIPHLLRDTLAELLGLSEWQVSVQTGDVGGGFGVKSTIYPEDIVVAYLAKQLEQPVQWLEDRRESLTTTTHARDQIHQVKLAAMRDGRILGLYDRILCDVGAYSVFPWTAAIEPLMAGGAMPGPYRIDHYAYETIGIATNKFPEGPYRGVARPATTFVMARDLVYEELEG